MGISGLLQFIKDASESMNVKKYRGQTVAVDTYCWLHKGAFSCADKLAKGEPTDQYVWYCMKFVDMLLNFGVRPVLVFDGRNLPSKKEVEKSRRERREANLQKGRQLLRDGKLSEARECFNRCVNITPAMAHNLIKTARARGVDCIVAPYEADAQLAFLSKTGLAQAVITEDSDLLAFGCKKVILKMDRQGNGLEIDQSNLGRCKSLGNVFTEERFRHMCILSGCDYLSSLHGIGLGKACKLLRLAKDPDILKVIKKMGQYLKMDLVVPDSYIEGFIRANNTFLYQLVFDPVQRRVVPLNPYPEHVDPTQLSYAGLNIGDEKGLQMALGNLDLNSLETIDHFCPDTPQTQVSKPRSRSWKDSASSTPSHCSIWGRDGSSSAPLSSSSSSSAPLSSSTPSPQKRASTRGQQRVVNVGALRLQIKRPREDSPLSEKDMFLQYSSNDHKRLRPSSIPSSAPPSSSSSSSSSSGAGLKRRNCFATVLQRRNQDSGEEAPLTCSRFFSSSSTPPSAPPPSAHVRPPPSPDKPSAADLENLEDDPEAPSVDTPSPYPSPSPQNSPLYNTAAHENTVKSTEENTTASSSASPSSRGQKLFHWTEPSSQTHNQMKPVQNQSGSGVSALKRFQFKKENISLTKPPSPNCPDSSPDSPPSQDSAYFSPSQPSASEREESLCCSQPSLTDETDLSPTERRPSTPSTKTPGLSRPHLSLTQKPRSLGPARASGLKRKPGSTKPGLNKPGLNNENSPGVQATISGLWRNFSFKKDSPKLSSNRKEPLSPHKDNPVVC